MKNFFSYLKKLYSKTSVIVFNVLDIIYLILSWSSPNIVISPIVFGILLFIGIIWGNYQLYQEYKSDSIDISVLFPNLISSDENNYEIALKRIDVSLIDKKTQSKVNSLKAIHTKDINKRKTSNALDITILNQGTYNYDYLEDVIKFESDFRNHLLLTEKAKHQLIKFVPNIRNISQSTLNNNRVEFLIPDPLKIPDSKQLSLFESFGYISSPPMEPKLYNRTSFEMLMETHFGIQSNCPSENILNITGPFFDRDSIIYYKINTLIPDYTEKDFKPFYLWFDNVSSNQVISLQLNLYCSKSPTFITKIISIDVKVTCPPKSDPSRMLQIRQKEAENAKEATIFH